MELLGVMDLICVVVMTTFALIKEPFPLKSAEHLFLEDKRQNKLTETCFGVPTPNVSNAEASLNLEMKSDTSN